MIMQSRNVGGENAAPVNLESFEEGNKGRQRMARGNGQKKSISDLLFCLREGPALAPPSQFQQMEGVDVCASLVLNCKERAFRSSVIFKKPWRGFSFSSCGRSSTKKIFADETESGEVKQFQSILQIVIKVPGGRSDH